MAKTKRPRGSGPVKLSEGASIARPNETVVIVGNSVFLPQGISSREKLFGILSEKRQMSMDSVEAGRYHETEIDMGRDHPWKLKNKYANCFTLLERQEFDAAFFRVPVKLVRNMQVEQFCLLEAAYRAVEDAGIPLEQLRHTATGIFAAAYTPFLLCPNAPDETNLRGSIMSTLADQVAYFLGTHGPSVTLETACSSSMVAVTVAVNSLLIGDCDIAIVVGNNSFGQKDFQLSLQACGVLVEGPTSHPFDQDGAKGFLRCEGFGALVLKRTRDTVQRGDRILAEILAAVAGSAGAAEGATEGAGRVYEQPCAMGMRELFVRTLRKGGVSPTDIDYFECHATGTAVGDIIELDAIGSVYGDARPEDQPLRIASIKSNIGHAELAAGIFSITKVLAMFEERIFLPTAGVETPLTNFEWSAHHMAVQQDAEPFPSDKRVLVAASSFGIGGSYGHIVLGEWKPSAGFEAPALHFPLPATSTPLSIFPLLLSASSLKHLQVYCRSMADHLRQRPTMTNGELINLCGTAALHRSRFPFRKAFVGTSVDDLMTQLEGFAEQGKVEPVVATNSPRVAMILTGQGSQYARNGMDLMDAFPIYRQTAQAVDQLFSTLSGWSILKKIETLTTEDMADTREAQPITFLVEVALLATLKYFGITPDLVIGHSAGETAAAYAVGLLTLEEAVKVVYHRSTEQQKLAGSGRMLAIGLGVEELLPLLGKCAGLEVACINSPQSTVVAGPVTQLEQLKLLLPSSTSSTFLPGSIAFHSSYTEPVRPGLHAALTRALGPRPATSPLLPFISTVSGQQLTGPCDATYLCDNMRQPVLFKAAIEHALSFEPMPAVMLEVGPHRTLVAPVQQTIQALGCEGVDVMAIQDRREAGPSTLLQTLARLFEAGASLDMDHYFRHHVHAELDRSMPGHPFLRTQKMYQIIPGLIREGNLSMYRSGPVAAQQQLFGSCWAVEVCERTVAWLKHHKLGGEVIAPGALWTEMVLEAASGPENETWPLTLVDVEYKAKLPIPRSTAGDFSAYVHLTLGDPVDGSTRSFSIKSCASRWPILERPMMLTHCTGHVVASSGVPLLSLDGEITEGPVPVGYGAIAPLPHFRDLGPEGLKQLRDRHTCVENDSRESFYAAHMVEGIIEHTGPFQMVTGFYTDAVNRTILARLEGENPEWTAEGGIYPVELLDAMVHPIFFDSESHVLGYVGGYRAGHFLRRPETRTMWSLFLPDENMIQVGNRKNLGDLLLYDDNGRLLVYLHALQIASVILPDPFKLCTQAWQPAGLSCDVTTHAAELQRALVTAAPQAQWSQARNCGLSAWLARQLVEAGVSSFDTANGPLDLSTLMSEEGQEQADETVLAMAKLGGAAERVFSQSAVLIQALLRKGALDEREEEKGTLPVEAPQEEDAPEAPQKEEPSKELSLSAADLHELWTIASLQASEAQAMAEAMVALASAELEKLTADGTGTSLVLRVLEVAQGPTPCVADCLSQCQLPRGLTVECFLACHDARVLQALASGFNRRNKGFRLRRVLLPPGGSLAALRSLLHDLTFHFLLLDDWAGTGAGVWVRDDQPAASNALQTLKPFLAPHAHVLIRGLAPVPAWLHLVSLLSPTPLVEGIEARRLAVDWRQVLPQAEGDALMLGSAEAEVGGEAHRVLVVAYSEEQGAEVAQALQTAAAEGAALFVDHVVVDDTASTEDIVAALKEALVLDEEEKEEVGSCDLPSGGADPASDIEDGPGITLSGLDKLRSKTTSTTDTSGSEESSITLGSDANGWRSGCRVGGIVFAAAMGDDSVIGDKGFSRLLRLVQALQRSQDLLASHADRRTDESPWLWVLTRGLYGGPQLCPQQGTIQGLTTVLYCELPNVVTKLVDVPATVDGSVEPGSLQSVMRLVLSRAREQCYRVEKEGRLLVPRMLALDRQSMRSATVLPDGPENFYVDTLCGNKKLFRGKFTQMGQLTAHFRLRDLPPLRDDEVLVDVHAAALNFRDMMVALSMLPETSYERSYFGKNLGLEAAGVIKAVGEGVDPEHLKVGDRVMMSEPASFTNRLIAPAARVIKLPDEVNMTDAASTLSVYTTCHHALITLARVRKGETVLIHAAAGGVGHAAISICQHVGCEIYATAGSDEKRQLLRDMGIRHVYDSRSTSWFADVMRDTDNQGVHVVLNSLAGEHQRLGVQALRSSGRFCEIGKVDIYANQSLGLMAFRKNVSFFAIDMDRLALDDPELSRQVCREVAENFTKGHYNPLPVSTFPMADLKKALELMRAGKHVGKVVLLNYDEQGAALPCVVERPLRVMRRGATYLITGGLGGFGSKLVTYAVAQGVQDFIISSRSTDELTPTLQAMSHELGIRYVMVKADTSIEADVVRLMEVARAHDPPVTTIVHCAGVSADATLADFKDGEDFDKVANGKALGAWYLSKHSQDIKLENFVVVSSVAALIGGMGVAAYAAANAYLDALVRYRHAQGLPGTTFNMGSVSDAGILVKNMQARRFQKKLGVEYLKASRAVEELELGLHASVSPVVTMFFKQQTRQLFASQAAWSHLLDDPIILGVSTATGPMTVKEIAAHLSEEIKAITQASEVLVTSSLINLGLDSFGFIELSGRIQRTFAIDISSIKLTPEQNLLAVAAVIHKLKRRGQEASGNGKAEDQAASQDGQEDKRVRILESSASVGTIMSSPAPALGTGKTGLASLRSLLPARPTWPLAPHKPSAYLLFGATGLVGCHILRDLLEHKTRRGPVYCVVFRCFTPEGAAQRVIGRMKQLQIWKPQYAGAFVALPGDMTKDVWFDLPAPVYERLVVEVGCVIHAASSRRWAVVQDADTQLAGISNVVAFARRNRAIVHYTSSMWVDALDIVDTAAERETLASVAYVAHKRRAEDMLDYACKTLDIQAVAYRQALVTASSQGAFFGDLVLLDEVRLVYATGMATPQDEVWPVIRADAMAKWVTHEVVSRRASSKPLSRLEVLTSLPFSEPLRILDLCDVAEELRGSPVNRSATKEEFQAALPEHSDRLDVFSDDIPQLLTVIGRAVDRLVGKAEMALSSTSRSVKIRNALMRMIKRQSTQGGQGPSALACLVEYIRANPEVVTQSRLATAILDRQRLQDGDAKQAESQVQNEGILSQ